MAEELSLREQLVRAYIATQRFFSNNFARGIVSITNAFMMARTPRCHYLSPNFVLTSLRARL